MINLRNLVRKLKREPGVIGVYLVGSALLGKEFEDLDIALILDETVVKPLDYGEELKEKYQDTLVMYANRRVLLDLYIHPTGVPAERWLEKVYFEGYVQL